ncbi:MAG: ComEC family competence protein [Candidatus Omnitrophica bacterium]|nr:ComEC family competence protein [Candidatus Omnitrophota bacterium]
MKAVYTHRPFVAIAISFCLGIAAGYKLPVPAWIWCVSALSMLLVCWRVYLKFPPFLIFLLIGFSGAVYTNIYQAAIRDDFARQKLLNAQQVYIEGVVAADPIFRAMRYTEKTVFTVELNRARIVDKNPPEKFIPMQGKVLVNVFRKEEVIYGEKLGLKGKFSRPMEFGKKGQFSYRDYLARAGIGYTLNVKKAEPLKRLGKDQGQWVVRLAYAVRKHFRRIFDNNFSPDESGLVRALMLGDRTGVPFFISDIFMKTGTTHILAISGFNIAILAVMVLVFLKFFPFHRNIIMSLAVIFLIFNMIMTDMSASVVRATIMASVVLIAFMVERPKDHFNILGVAAFVVLIFDPLYLFDIGFQLSFVCVLSLIVLQPKVKAAAEKLLGTPKNKVVSWLSESLLVSLAVWIGVMPLIIYYFHLISFVSLLANLLIPFLMSLAMFLAMGVMFFSFFSVYVMKCFVIVLKLLLNLTIGATFLFAECPYGYVQTKEQNGWFILGYYLMLGVILYKIKETEKIQLVNSTKNGTL